MHIMQPLGFHSLPRVPIRFHPPIDLTLFYWGNYFCSLNGAVYHEDAPG
jgi:hypothetical protein